MNNSNTVVPMLFCFVIILYLFEKKVGEINEVAGFIIFMTIGFLCYSLIFDKKN